MLPPTPGRPLLLMSVFNTAPLLAQGFSVGVTYKY